MTALDEILFQHFGKYDEPPEVTKLKKDYYEKVEEANEFRKLKNEKLNLQYQLEKDFRKW